MDAGAVSEQDLIAVLRLIQVSPKPVLLHCWHGSDRTGFIVAGYRMVVMNWSAGQAIEEMRLGGFGFHESYYQNIIETLAKIDVPAVRKAVLTPLPDQMPPAESNAATPTAETAARQP
jgi:protein tyrosine/serine phosphatase